MRHIGIDFGETGCRRDSVTSIGNWQSAMFINLQFEMFVNRQSAIGNRQCYEPHHLHSCC